jgi:hypothetical protein
MDSGYVWVGFNPSGIAQVPKNMTAGGRHGQIARAQIRRRAHRHWKAVADC